MGFSVEGSCTIWCRVEKEELSGLHLDLNGSDITYELSVTLSDHNLLNTPLAKVFKWTTMLVQPCIINQLDSWTCLPPHFLSLTQRGLLTVNYCDLVCLLPHWRSYNALYGASAKYKFCMGKALLCSSADKQGRTPRQEIWGRKLWS